MTAKKPKTATVKPAAPKSTLYTAVRDILEAKDRDTLDARTDAKVSAVLMLLGDEFAFVRDPQAVHIPNIAAPAPVQPVMPWSLDGLVVDPGEEAVGQWGWFWDRGDDGRITFSQCVPDGGCTREYESLEGASWDHFAYLPNFPGAALLKATTGYAEPE